MLGAAQAWTNNSGNLFTVSGGIALSGDNPYGKRHRKHAYLRQYRRWWCHFNPYEGRQRHADSYRDACHTAVTNRERRDPSCEWFQVTITFVTVNNAGTTLGGTGTIGGTVMVNAGANLAPGNGGNNTGTLTIQARSHWRPGSNFRVDINGTAAGTFDQVVVNTSTVTITGSNLVVHVGTTLSVGQTFQILTKGSGSAITGTFAGIPKGVP